ncbi:MAG: ABC-F family ATP-binding cassette domain-containing protein [Oscillospiraceae bacterium]|nr:ABC-F family ATP-binding cassette domain-containing protein [Oscillospiraceae bacterium]MCI9309161.1 ABC-F family ATP-binding cassette domain-containing protein [Oscillospiraceae bacterium]
MYQVKDLTITHKKDLTTLVEGLSLTLAPGDRAAIIGEEGNGKSTVLKLLYDPALVEPYAEWTGEIVDKGLRRGYLAQELSPEELARPVWEFCQGSSAFEGADPRALDRAARQVGLSPELFWDGRPMSTLSGGERVKLRLALLLLDGPDLLLLDEPSNDLDLRTLNWLEEFLLGCEVPVLYISHDERLLERTANVVVHLERLRRRTLPRCTVARVGYERYVEERAARFARQERNAAQERRAYEAKMERYRQIRDKVDHRQATITRQDPHGGRMLKKKMHAVQSLGRRFEREREDMTAMPEWEEAILAAFDEGKSAFPAGKTALRLDLPELRAGERVLSRNIRLWVTGPEKIGIVGPNGAGKSTLLKLAAQELLPRTDLRAAYMPQDYGELLLGDRTPVEMLAPSGRRDDVTRARTLLGNMKYKAEEMEHPAAGLSGGQRAKLLFLAMALNGANVLMLDEPTRNFSPLSAPNIRRVLADHPGVIVSVSHDRAYLEQVCTRVLELGPEGLRPV